MLKNQKLADLVQGIEDLLSKSRCPLTDDEKVLLENCLTELRRSNEKVDPSIRVESATKWLLLLFDVWDKLKDAF